MISISHSININDRYHTHYNDSIHAVSINKVIGNTVSVFSLQRPNLFEVPIEHLFDTHAKALDHLLEINPDLYTQNEPKFTKAQLAMYQQAH